MHAVDPGGEQAKNGTMRGGMGQARKKMGQMMVKSEKQDRSRKDETRRFSAGGAREGWTSLSATCEKSWR